MTSPADIPGRLVHLLQQAYGPSAITGALSLLQQGRCGNANLYRYTDATHNLVIKEFHSRPWVIRMTIGRFLIRREARVLTDLDGMDGIPSRGRRLDFASLAESYVEGHTLSHLHRVSRVRLPKIFFLELERIVDGMHRAGYAHLDLRNLGNIVCGQDQKPYLLDFQSCMRTTHLPRTVRSILEASDRSGVCKCWVKLCEEPLDPAREAFWRRFNRTRRLWILKGY